MSDMKRAVL